jgi:surfactin synthase thioesterase subunit
MKKKFKLFCLPYAGGSSAVFNKWRQYLDKRIEMHAVELAGRGRRIYDPLYDSIEEAVDDVYNIVKGLLDETPYAIFGHSMGGIIAYELAQKISTLKQPPPDHIFFSGRGAPHVPRNNNKMFHKMPEKEFKKEIIDLGGTPKEFFDHPELIDVLLPTLRSDFKIAETYEKSKDIKPLNCDITVFIGKEEDVKAEQMHGWKEHTNKICTIHYFEGEHFFINEKMEKIVKIINNQLLMVNSQP